MSDPVIVVVQEPVTQVTVTPTASPNVVLLEPVAQVEVVSVDRTLVVKDGRGLGPQGPVGPPGAPGTPGAAPQAYVHTQNAVSSTWFITHNLGFQPAVTVTDSGGTGVEGEINRIDNNHLSLSFTSAFAGTAYLS